MVFQTAHLRTSLFCLFALGCKKVSMFGEVLVGNLQLVGACMQLSGEFRHPVLEGVYRTLCLSQLRAEGRCH